MRFVDESMLRILFRPLCLRELIKSLIEEICDAKTLQEKCNRLQAQVHRVQGMVDEALREGELISPMVTNWQRKAKIKSADLVDMLGNINYPQREMGFAKEIDELVTDGQKMKRYNVSRMPKLLTRLRLPDRLAGDYNATPSTEKLLDVLKAALVGNNDDQKNIIGVYGEQGAGKTTLVRKLAVEIDSVDEYKGVVLMSGQQLAVNGVHYIQDLIAESIGFDLYDYETLEVRARKVNDCLSDIHKKVLIIIDDLEEMIDFTQIGIPWPYHIGCRIVVVSRSLTVCRTMQTQMNLQVQPLTQDESLAMYNALVDKYGFTSTSGSAIHILSKPAWLPGQLRDYIHQEYECKLSDFGFRRQFQETSAVNCSYIDPEFMCTWYPDRWDRFFNPATDRIEVKLLKVWCLHVEGQANKELLNPATKYGAYFVYKLSPGAEGFKTNKVDVVVGSSTKTCYLDPLTAASFQSKRLVKESDMPRKKDAEWLEIEMGCFYNNKCSDAPINLIIKNHNETFPKTGLHIRGIELRPHST